MAGHNGRGRRPQPLAGGRGRPGRESGFTLLEVLVAAFILAVAVGALVMTLQKSADATADVLDRELAFILAESKLAELELGLERDGSGTFGGDYGRFHWRVERERVSTREVALERLNLAVTWPGRGRRQQIRLTHLLPARD